jgi:hypothetical protein
LYLDLLANLQNTLVIQHSKTNVTLGWIFRKWDVGVWTGLGWLRIQTVGGNCECGKEASGYIKCGEFIE